MFKMAAKGKHAEITIYGEIDAYFGIAANTFHKELKALGNVDTITLRIDSPGGGVFEGLTIYNMLRSHKARITTMVDGVAASIASVVALAGDNIQISSYGFFMIHNPAGIAVGESEEMRKTADIMDKVKDSIVDLYENRTGNKRADIVRMMDETTWMNADEAKSKGFAHSIYDGEKIAACANLSAYDFKNIPAALGNHKPVRAFAAPNRSR